MRTSGPNRSRSAAADAPGRGRRRSPHPVEHDGGVAPGHGRPQFLDTLDQPRDPVAVGRTEREHLVCGLHGTARAAPLRCGADVSKDEFLVGLEARGDVDDHNVRLPAEELRTGIAPPGALGPARRPGNPGGHAQPGSGHGHHRAGPLEPHRRGRTGRPAGTGGPSPPIGQAGPGAPRRRPRRCPRRSTAAPRGPPRRRGSRPRWSGRANPGPHTATILPAVVGPGSAWPRARILLPEIGPCVPTRSGPAHPGPAAWVPVAPAAGI